MQITFDQAILLEITNIDKIKSEDLVQIEKKAKKRWHPDRVTHLNDPVINEEYTQKFQQVELAIQLLASFLNGSYQAGDVFNQPFDFPEDEPVEIIRQEAPAMQSKLRSLWDAIKVGKYKWYDKEVLLSDGFKLKDLLHEDFKEDIAMLSVVSMFYGMVILGILAAIAGGISPILGSIVGIIWLAHVLSCFLGFLPLSRFWLPNSVSDIMIKFINFGLGIYNWAEDQIANSTKAWAVLLVRLPVIFAKLIKYLVLFPLYELAKIFIGDKVVGIVKQNVSYYADGAEWYIDELIHAQPNEMSEEELFHLSYFYSELSDFIPGAEYAAYEKAKTNDVPEKEATRPPPSPQSTPTPTANSSGTNQNGQKVQLKIHPKAKKLAVYSIGALLVAFGTYKGIEIYNKNQKANETTEANVDTPSYPSPNGQMVENNQTFGSNNANISYDSAYVKADDYLSLKTQPDINADRIIKILPGEKMAILAKTSICKTEEGKYNCWYQVNYGGNVGYVFGAYLGFNSDLGGATENDFYIVNVAAIKTESEASAKVQQLRSQGYQAGYLWIPDYSSLSGAQLYAAYIGPFKAQYDCEVATENYRKIDPGAYGLLVSNHSDRVQINGLGKVVLSSKNGNEVVRNNLIGIWRGKIGKKEFELNLLSAGTGNINGYNIAGTNRRPVTGTYEFFNNNNSCRLILKEPGDDKWDGTFSLLFEKRNDNWTGTGTWTSYNNQLSNDISISRDFSTTSLCNLQDGDQAVLITGDNVRVRTRPDAGDDNTILFRLNINDRAKVLEQTVNEKNETWYKLCYSGNEGWLISNYANLYRVGTNDEKLISFSGTYAVTQAEPPYNSAEDLIVSISASGKLMVRGSNWKGEGQFDGNKGYYDWKINNGATGRTLLEVENSRDLIGNVKGEGINWKYRAKKKG